MEDDIYYHKITYLEQVAKMVGEKKSYLVFASVHEHGCKCETCLKWWVCLGPLDRDGAWDFGPFTRQEFEEGGGVVAFNTPNDMYLYHEAL